MSFDERPPDQYEYLESGAVVSRPTISTFHRWVLLLGLPFVVIPPFIYLAFASAAHDGPTNPGRGEIFIWTVTGQFVVDTDALLAARVWLLVWLLGCIATIVLTVLGARRGR